MLPDVTPAGFSRDEIAARFIRYASVNTQANPDSESCPSSPGQLILGDILVEDLKRMGIADAVRDEHGYVYATLPSNVNQPVPVVCLCAHLDTSPDCPGGPVKPVVHRSYPGGAIILPGAPAQVIDPAEHPALEAQVGYDIITSDGTTLLGADDKAGITVIMEAVRYLLLHPEVLRGKVRILFTPDEEIGRGVDRVDLQRLAADVAYTLDGDTVGHIDAETFSADEMTVEFHGRSAHPGFAFGKMVNAQKVAADFISRLPDHLSPEFTQGREGFVHPVDVRGDADVCRVTLIIRDFETTRLTILEETVRELAALAVDQFPGSAFRTSVRAQYRNMKDVLDRYPNVVALAAEAVRRAGVEPVITAIRGGTDGSRLSHMGLPCPNIFTGEHAFHSRTEWVSVGDMQKSAAAVVHLIHLWSASIGDMS